MAGKTKLYFEELRAPFLTASILPVLLGTSAAAVKTGRVEWAGFAAALIGGCLLHSGANVANDYFDYKSGNDNINKEFIRPFSGGSRLIQKGLLTSREVLGESLILFLLSIIAGVYLTIQKGYAIPIFGLAGFLSGFFYSSPPFRLAGSGIGEFIIGLNFGTLMTAGAFFVQTGYVNLDIILISLPLALLIAAVVYINEFPDFTADRQVGKKTLVVRLGKEKAVTGYYLLVYSSYVITGLLIAAGLLPIWAAAFFLTLPPAVKAAGNLKANHSDSARLAPSNAMTIKLHMASGLILTLSYIISYFVGR